MAPPCASGSAIRADDEQRQEQQGRAAGASGPGPGARRPETDAARPAAATRPTASWTSGRQAAESGLPAVRAAARLRGRTVMTCAMARLPSRCPGRGGRPRAVRGTAERLLEPALGGVRSRSRTDSPSNGLQANASRIGDSVDGGGDEIGRHGRRDAVHDEAARRPGSQSGMSTTRESSAGLKMRSAMRVAWLTAADAWIMTSGDAVDADAQHAERAAGPRQERRPSRSRSASRPARSRRRPVAAGDQRPRSSERRASARLKASATGLLMSSIA